MSNQDLIEAIDTLTNSVRNLSGYIQELRMTLETNGNKVSYLSGKTEENTKEISKLTTEVNRNTFK